jgi:hypothetical protein
VIKKQRSQAINDRGNNINANKRAMSFTVNIKRIYIVGVRRREQKYLKVGRNNF